jgi:hypothetical protein
MRQSLYCLIDSPASLLFMKKSGVTSAALLPASYQRLRARLGKTGWLALGSVVERTLPGYQWSRRVEGKTVTVALSREQFAWLKQAIARQRQVESLLSQMHQLTLRYMWKHLPSTSRRKRLSNKTLGLN